MQNWIKTFFLFFLLGLLVYFNSLNNKFIMDDYVLLSNPVMSQAKFIFPQLNPYLNQALGVQDSSKSFTGYYRPLAHVVYAFCYGFFKFNYWQYHLLNLFLFVLASSLICLCIEKVTGNFNLAFLAGLFFLIHPINGILVNNIVTNAVSLQLIFIMATILLLWESLERKNDRTLYFLSLLFSFLSLFWYDMGLMTPLYVSAVILLRDGVIAKSEATKQSLKNKSLLLLPYFLISFSYLFLRSFLLNGTPFLKDIAYYHMTTWEYLATLFRLIMWYIIQLFYPQSIVMEWATPISHKYLLWLCLGAFSLLMIFFFLILRFSKQRIILIALAWILIGFSPVCLVAFRNPYIGALIEPHWFIFSSLGFAILAAYFCLFLIDRIKIAGLILLFIVIFAWGAVSHAYNQIWSDEKTYALFWSQKVPNLKMTYAFLADAYLREGAFKEARKYYRLALEGSNKDKETYHNIGVIDEQDGHLKEAELDYKMALKVDPYAANSYNNLGSLYLKQGQWEKAKRYFRQAMSYNPLLLEPRRGLAAVFLNHSEYQKAIDLCLINLDIVKDDTETLFCLIDIYIHKKDFIAIKKYAYHIIITKTDPAILTRLGSVMAFNNIFDIAIDSYMMALRVAPDYKDTYLQAGVLFLNLGKHDEAIHIWKQGLSIDPYDQRFKTNIAKAIKLKSK